MADITGTIFPKRPIFLIEELEDSRVDSVAYIEETNELYVHLKDLEKHRPEDFAYFFQNCKKNLLNKIKESKDRYKYIKDYIYPKYDYSLEYIWNGVHK